jgi:hypothetical protein
MPRFHRFGAIGAIAATFSMVIATPALAVELPHLAPVTVQAQDDSAGMSRRGGWGRPRHRGGVDGGDILAGVLILGGIAAVASAVDSSNRDRDYRDYPPPPPRTQGRYDYRDGPARSSSTGGLDRAADICADAVDRSIARVNSVDNVRRSPSGWDVDGTLEGGSPFTCSIGSDGQIRDIQTDRSYNGAAYDSAPPYDGGSYDPGNDNRGYHDQGYEDQNFDDLSYRGTQYDEETYARMRESRDGA